MDLNAKVAALEEEVGILKGEIKSVLQELRTLILARDNPFALDVPEARSPAPQPVAAPTVSAMEPAPQLPAPSPLTASFMPAAEPPVSLRDELPALLSARPNLLSPRPRLAASNDVGGHEDPADPDARRPLDSRTLASLMAWTQEAAQRFCSDDFAIVLSLARYGGLVSPQLEKTLTTISSSLEMQPNDKRATILDFLLSLRQLEAVLGLPVHAPLSQSNQEVA